MTIQGSELKRFSEFSSFQEDDLQELMDNAQTFITKHEKGSMIYMEGEACLTWDVILEGEVTIRRIDENGNTMTVATMKKGDSLGGSLLFSQSPGYPMSVMAKTDTRILHIKKDGILSLCQKNSSFLEQYLARVSDRTVFLTKKIKLIAMKTIRELIMEYLHGEYLNQKNSRIKLPMNKKELSELMGISRTSLSRELQKMKNDGLIDYDRESITLKTV